MNVFDLVQSSGKPIEHFLADDQFLSLHFIYIYMYVSIYLCVINIIFSFRKKTRL